MPFIKKKKKKVKVISSSTHCLKTHRKTHHKGHAVVASIKHAILQTAVMQRGEFYFPFQNLHIRSSPQAKFLG